MDLIPPIPVLSEISWALKAKKFFTGLFKSPWFYVGLAFIAIGGGTYLYLDHQTKQLVTTKVAQANSDATIQSYKAKDEVNTRTQAVDQKFDRLHERTTKDYDNARTHLQSAPQEERDAQAPRIIIDTLNDLDRMRASRDADAVPDADVPVG